MNDVPSFPLSKSAEKFFVNTLSKMSEKDKAALLDSFPLPIRDKLQAEMTKKQNGEQDNDD